MEELAARYEQLERLTRRVARAAAELRAAAGSAAPLANRQQAELELLADRVQALQLELANETERAWNRAEATARRARHARMLARVHDATTPDAPLGSTIDPTQWPPLELDERPDG